MHTKALTPQIIDMRERGLSHKEIGQALGLSKSAVGAAAYRHRHAAAVSERRKRRSGVAVGAYLYNEALTAVDEYAQQMGETRSTAIRELVDFGLLSLEDDDIHNLDAPALRRLIATAAGLLAHHTSDLEADEVLRRIAARIGHRPMEAA